MMLEVGKLYICSGYFLLLFPDKETADPFGAARASAADAEATASYWSKKFDKPVSYCNPETALLVLSTVNKYVEVLAGDCKGWIINEDWLKIKEIVNEAA